MIEKSFSVSKQTEITSEDESISFPHRFLLSNANDELVSASEREQIRAARHVVHWIFFFTILITYPAM
jgi:hypothetical protein